MSVLATCHPVLRFFRISAMVLQLIMWIIALPVSWVYTHDQVLLALQASIGLAMLIYVPVALYIDLRNRYTTRRPFDSARGEVTYLAITTALWLATGIWICSFLNTSYHCMDWTKDGDLWIGSECVTHAAMAAIGFFQFVVSSAWLASIIWLVHGIPEPMNDAFKISVSLLIRSGGYDYYKGQWATPYDTNEVQEQPFTPTVDVRPVDPPIYPSEENVSPPLQIAESSTSTRDMTHHQYTQASQSTKGHKDGRYNDMKSEITKHKL